MCTSFYLLGIACVYELVWGWLFFTSSILLISTCCTGRKCKIMLILFCFDLLLIISRFSVDFHRIRLTFQSRYVLPGIVFQINFNSKVVFPCYLFEILVQNNAFLRVIDLLIFFLIKGTFIIFVRYSLFFRLRGVGICLRLMKIRCKY